MDLYSQEIREEKRSTKPQTIKKMAIGTDILIITLNVSGLNASTKRHRLAEWVQKQDPYICCLHKTHFRPKDTYRLKVRGWDNIFHANGKQKKSGVLLLLLSHFSRVRLCATPWTAAHQAPLSLGFSRQEHWSGLPFPSLMHES